MKMETASPPVAGAETNAEVSASPAEAARLPDQVSPLLVKAAKPEAQPAKAIPVQAKAPGQPAERKVLVRNPPPPESSPPVMEALLPLGQPTTPQRRERQRLTTTQIYTHVIQRPGLGVRSPLNELD